MIEPDFDRSAQTSFAFIQCGYVSPCRARECLKRATSIAEKLDAAGRHVSPDLALRAAPEFGRLITNANAASKYLSAAIGANRIPPERFGLSRSRLAALIEPSKSSPSLPQTADSDIGFLTQGIWNPLRWRSAFSMFGLVRADKPVTFHVSQLDIRHGRNSKFSPAIVSSLVWPTFLNATECPKCWLTTVLNQLVSRSVPRVTRFQWQ